VFMDNYHSVHSLNFLALSPEESALESANVVLIPIPYDSTTSHISGAREGPAAIIRSSTSLEDYDHDLDVDLSLVGIHTASFLEPHMGGPWHMIARIKDSVEVYLSNDRLIGLLGGEHTVTIGGVMAMRERYPKLSVLYLDAHGDLRDQYMGTHWGHASVARRVSELASLVQIGVRSVSTEEIAFIKSEGVNTFFLNRNFSPLTFLNRVLPLLNEHVYLSVDLDVLDPSIMAAVGTPEPGGMTWDQVSSVVETLSKNRTVVGFDLTELSPRLGPEACAVTAAKLVHKIIACVTHNKTG
jgi:agmatinase